MTNKQYTEKTFNYVERILVDTSTLMSPGISNFIENNKENLLTSGKKIIINKAVYTEIGRHLCNEKSEKNKLALEAVRLMSENKDIFEIESAPLTDDEIAHAFADAQILSELTINKPDYNQLLLTNDKKLSCDAFNINLQQSCKGRKVFVCYINCNGEMQCCECVQALAEMEEKDAESEKIKSKGLTDEETIECDSDKTITWKFDLKSGALSLLGIGMLYGLYKGGQAIIRNM